eukprot:1335778-Pyramimonas_sp.AAC.1
MLIRLLGAPPSRSSSFSTLLDRPSSPSVPSMLRRCPGAASPGARGHLPCGREPRRSWQQGV